MSERIEWFKEARRFTNLSTKVAKKRFAKRLKTAGVELLYGASGKPISMTYKEKPFSSDSRLAELCQHIDKQIWDSV